MEIKGKVHCLFEQSGTFKREFIKLGIPAEDYDIQNNFGQTDHVVDLFDEIEQAYEGGKIFEKITQDDLVLAFFPCVYFSAVSQMNFVFTSHNNRKMKPKDRADRVLERSANRERFFRLAVQMISCVEQRGLRLIMENPWNEQTFLKNNFVYPPTIIDKNRMLRGDYFVKPTAYWFIGCEPTQGHSYQNDKQRKSILKIVPSKERGICSEERSMISPDYARNFICDFVIGKKTRFRTENIIRLMKCSDCKYWFNSKTYGQGCNCPGVRPCDIEKNNKKKKFQRQYKKKKKERYANQTRE